MLEPPSKKPSLTGLAQRRVHNTINHGTLGQSKERKQHHVRCTGSCTLSATLQQPTADDACSGRQPGRANATATQQRKPWRLGRHKNNICTPDLPQQKACASSPCAAPTSMPAFALRCHAQTGACESGSHGARAGEAALDELGCREVVIARFARQLLHEAFSKTQLQTGGAGGAADRHLDFATERS